MIDDNNSYNQYAWIRIWMHPAALGEAAKFLQAALSCVDVSID